MAGVPKGRPEHLEHAIRWSAKTHAIARLSTEIIDHLTVIV